MKFIVHIGTEKTGTSSIQAYLMRNREELMSRGIYFVGEMGLPNNRDLPSYCMREDRSDDYFGDARISTVGERRAFKAEVEARFHREMNSLSNSMHTVVISSEHFHSRLVYADEIDALKNLLVEYSTDITIVTYLRNQVDTVLSLYSTLVKTGGTRRLDDLVQEVNPNNPYYNYDLYLGKWEQVFGIESICVRLFDKSEFTNGDLLDDFVSVIDKSLVGVLDKEVSVENESLSYMGQVFGRAVNMIMPKYAEDAVVDDKRSSIIAYIASNFKGTGELLSEETISSIIDEFMESNDRVRDRYFTGRGSLFTGHKKKKVDAQFPKDLDEKIAGILELCTESRAYPPASFASVLRDAALLLEDRDLLLSFKLMEFAGKIRPEGPLIRKKLAEYKARLDG